MSLFVKIFEIDDVFVGDQDIEQLDKNWLVGLLREDKFEYLVIGDGSKALPGR